MDMQELEKILQASWSKETSYSPELWNESNSALGQCAISSLIVNDYFWGEIVWSQAILPNKKKVSHYFNLLETQEVDMTRSQFPQGTIIPLGVKKSKNFSTTREYILSNLDTKKRYEILKKIIQN